jgi:putative ABC transport system permease protein
MRTGILPIVAALLAAGAVPARAQFLEIAVDRRTAVEFGLAVGDTIKVGPAADAVTTLAVISAIYRAPDDPATLMRRERNVRLHLGDLAALLGAPDRVDRWGVVLEPGADPGEAAAVLNAGAFGYHAAPSAEIAAESSRTFEVVRRFHRAIAVIAVAAGAVFLLCIMLLKVDERRLDTAVLRFVGISRRTIVAAVSVEAALLALLGSLAGVFLAGVAAAVTNAYYRHAFDTELVFAIVTPGVVVFAVGLSVVLGIGAGVLAAVRLAGANPLALWRRTG